MKAALVLLSMAFTPTIAIAQFGPEDVPYVTSKSEPGPNGSSFLVRVVNDTGDLPFSFVVSWGSHLGDGTGVVNARVTPYSVALDSNTYPNSGWYEWSGAGIQNIKTGKSRSFTPFSEWEEGYHVIEDYYFAVSWEFRVKERYKEVNDEGNI
jgi:hypothetical protein